MSNAKFSVIVVCEYPGCTWRSLPDTYARASKLFKRHIDSDPHRDFVDVPLPF